MEELIGEWLGFTARKEENILRRAPNGVPAFFCKKFSRYRILVVSATIWTTAQINFQNCRF